MSEEVKPSDIIIGSFDLVMQLPNAPAGQVGVAHNPNCVTFHGYVHLGDTPEVIQKRINEWYGVGERVQERAYLPILEDQIKQMEMALEQQLKMREQLVEKRDKPGSKLKTVEADNLMKLNVSVDSIDKRIKELQDKREKLMKESGISEAA